MPLTRKQYGDIRAELFQGGAKADLQVPLGHLPSKEQMLAIYQLVDDDFQAMRQALRGKIATLLGVPNAQVSANLVKRIIIAFVAWKFRALREE